jgi:hypothetical protein
MACGILLFILVLARSWSSYYAYKKNLQNVISGVAGNLRSIADNGVLSL